MRRRGHGIRKVEEHSFKGIWPRLEGKQGSRQFSYGQTFAGKTPDLSKSWWNRKQSVDGKWDWAIWPQGPPSGNHFLQWGFISQRLQNLPKQCHGWEACIPTREPISDSSHENPSKYFLMNGFFKGSWGISPLDRHFSSFLVIKYWGVVSYFRNMLTRQRRAMVMFQPFSIFYSFPPFSICACGVCVWLYVCVSCMLACVWELMNTGECVRGDLR